MPTRIDDIPTFCRSFCTVVRNLSAAAVSAVLILLGSNFSSLAADERAVAIGSGDLLQVVVFGEESVTSILSGQFRVGADGSISYPILGSLQVDGKAPEEVAQMIRTALGEQVPISGVPTVSIAEYAPVYLLGFVQRPGPHPFFPGMTVMRLLLSAGGLPAVAQSDSTLVTLTQDLADLELTEYALEVRRLRLIAEVNGDSFDASTARQKPPDLAKDIVSAELAIHEAHQLAAKSLADGYRARRAAYDREIASLRESITLHGQEVALVEEDLAVQQGLNERGLVPRSRLSEVKRELVVMQRQALELQTTLFRAEQSRLDLDQRLDELEATSRIQALDTLRDVELELGRTRIKHQHVRAMLMDVQPEANAPMHALGRAARFTLIRSTPSGYKVSSADQQTPLQRGDILRVDFTSEETGSDPPASQADNGIVSASPQ